MKYRKIISLILIVAFLSLSNINQMKQNDFISNEISNSAIPSPVQNINFPRGQFMGGNNIELNWSESLNANYYNIYGVISETLIDMSDKLTPEFLLATTTDTRAWITDCGTNNKYTFAITAVNDDGESNPATIFANNINNDPYYGNMGQLLSEEDYQTSSMITYGNGTAEYPFIIADWQFYGGGSTQPLTIVPINNYHIIIENCTHFEGGQYSMEYNYNGRLIELKTVEYEEIITPINLTIRNNNFYSYHSEIFWLMPMGGNVTIENNYFNGLMFNLRNYTDAELFINVTNNVFEFTYQFGITEGVSGCATNNIFNPYDTISASIHASSSFEFYNSSSNIGNFWSDYEERYPLATNDGSVWDTPYEIDPSFFDNFPLYLEGVDEPQLSILSSDSSTGDIEIQIIVEASIINYNTLYLYRNTTEIIDFDIQDPYYTFNPNSGETTFIYNDNITVSGTYYYAAKYITAYGENESAYITFTAEIVPIIILTSESAIFYSTNVIINWTSDYADHYDIYRSSSSFSSIGEAELIESECVNNSYIDVISSPGAYYYRVLANNTFGETLSNEVEIEVILLMNFVSFNLLLVSEGHIQLNWSVNNGESYTIYRSNVTIADVNDADILIADYSENGYIDTTVELNVRYYYIIKAENTYGSPAIYSDEKSLISRDSPVIVEFVVDSNINGTVILSWDVFMGEEYKIWVNDADEFTGIAVNLTTNNDSVTIIFSSNDTKYFMLRASNEIGYSLSETIGINITITIAAQEPESEPEPEPEPGTNYITIIIIVTVGAGIGIGGYFLYRYIKTPKKASRIQAIRFTS